MKKTFVSESRLKALISESIRHVLNENARDKRALDFLKSKGYEDYNERMQIIGSLKFDIPNLRLDGNKFLLGASRMFLDGQLRDEQSIRKVDNALKFIHADGHTGEFDENLNGKSPDELHEMFREASRQMSANDRRRSASQQFSGGSQYRIIPINSYEEAEPYGKYTPWCVTHGKDAFDSYTQGGNRFYFCLKDGFENVQKDDDGAPLNEWGLSMIAVNIDMNGDLTRTTTRYNHDFNGENNPELETTEQLEKVLNVPFYQTFKPYTREELHAMGIILFDEVQELLDAGTPPRKIFQNVGDFSEGFARVYLNGKYNFIDRNCKLLSNTGFDYASDFSGGFALVELNNKLNYIDKNGKFLSNTWFEYACDFSEGFARVELNDKWNFIDKNGKFLSNTGFDDVGDFSGGFALVELNNKLNYIDKNGKFLSNTWFDYVSDFSEGFARVFLNGKYNFIDNNVKLLFNTWFDNVGDFSEGFARVSLNGKYNFIDRNCKLLSNTWFDYASDFFEGFGRVRLNYKWNFIDKNGKLYNERPSVNESRKPIRITESQLRQMVSEAVRKILRTRL